MITADLILPSLYHLQRLGRLGEITVCALGSGPLRALAENHEIRAAFPGSSFIAAAPACPRLPTRGSRTSSAQLVSRLPPRQVVFVAVPDQLHHDVVMAALRADQHVLCVKPLVLRHEQAREIAPEAAARGLFVGVEYHKRFDRRSLVARRDYRAGRFGELAFGEARLIEPWSYRRVQFPELVPAGGNGPVHLHRVPLRGPRGIHHGAATRGGLLCRRRGDGSPTATRDSSGRRAGCDGKTAPCSPSPMAWDIPTRPPAATTRDSCCTARGPGSSGMIRHDDHDRGVSHSYLEGAGPGGSHFNYVSPDFFRLVPWEGEGLRPVGYGYDSIEALVGAVRRVDSAAEGLAPAAAQHARTRVLRGIDEAGILATPANSSLNELVVEAGRLSILSDGRPARIEYGADPQVSPA